MENGRLNSVVGYKVSIFYSQSSILDPLFSIFDSRSSILDPRSSKYQRNNFLQVLCIGLVKGIQ